MKSILSKYKNVINILLPILITVCIFISNNLGQEISKIYTNHLLEVVTLNNTFITLAVSASTQNSESYQKTMSNLKEQMERFNKNSEMEVKELETKEYNRTQFDKIIYTLVLLMAVFNVIILAKNDCADLQG